MFGPVDYPIFLLSVLVFLVIPGPGSLAVLTATASRGPRGGYSALFGLMLGDWVLMAAAMAGVAAVLATQPLLFKAVQYLGVAYLLWTGWQRLRASAGEVGGAGISPSSTFRHGLLMTLINPKAIVFFMAFFLLFIDPARFQGLATLLPMAASISVLTLLYGSALVWVGNWAASRLRAQAAVRRWISRAAGAALVGFGVRLATD